MTFDPEQNRIPTGLLTYDERAALEAAKHGWQRYHDGRWWESTPPLWEANAVYRAKPAPSRASASLAGCKIALDQAWASNRDYASDVEAVTSHLKTAMTALEELYAQVKGECPSLLNDDSGGNGELALEIETLMEKMK